MLMATPVRRRPRLGRWFAGAAVLFALLAGGAAAGAWQADYRGYIVHTGSMSPSIPSGDLVLTRVASTYAVGDVITFEHGAGPQDLVTHRIIRITGAGISTKGDGNRTADVCTIAPDQAHGVVVAHLHDAGYVAYFFHQPSGVVDLLTSALGVLLLWGLFFPPTTRPSPHAGAWRGSFVPVRQPVRQPGGAEAPCVPVSSPAG